LANGFGLKLGKVKRLGKAWKGIGLNSGMKIGPIRSGQLSNFPKPWFGVISSDYGNLIFFLVVLKMTFQKTTDRIDSKEK